MQKYIGLLILLIGSFTLNAQILLHDFEQKNSITIKAGWDQTIALSVNYSHGIKPFFKTLPSNFQIEFLSPLAAYYKLMNGRISIGLQSEIYRKESFGLNASLFGTYSWTHDIATDIQGLGIFTSICPVYYTKSNWMLGVEFAYRPTIFAHFKFSEFSDNTFKDRYPASRMSSGNHFRNGWYSFTNNKLQLSLLVNKRLNSNYQLGLKLGFEHFINDFNVLLNGWIGQIPVNANISFTYSF